MPLSPRMLDWIMKREDRWNILLSLKRGEINMIQAENLLRILDGKDGR